ncbi:MAG: proton-conducting transporter membrane subunit [Candidatus Sumerlaeota bacterium]|nr:proton-conducting transporter membrane subunit [Candidatus Sumerlaeota bacterium]
MTILLASVGLLLASGLAALAAGRNPEAATRLGAGGAVLSCAIGLVAAVGALAGGSQATVQSFHLDWNIPYGSFAIALDPLSSFFLLPIFGLSALAAIYGAGYLKPFRADKPLSASRGIACRRHENAQTPALFMTATPGISEFPDRRMGAHWFFFNLLIAGMAMVAVARNAVLFLIAWEIMSVASFFLVTYDDEDADTRQAGWIYLIAAHLGVVFLMAMFVLLGRTAGSLDFERMAAVGAGGTLPAAGAGLIFVLAIVGFGSKAGFVPFHVWLPEAHPAAPSHVSALMSGVMIKMGIYGILRVLTFLGYPPAWWGMVLVGIGITSGILGVLFALAQHDLKRLLAYHSVENIGIIALGMGAGVLGIHYRLPALAALGFAGALLHVVNHALFKGLLFLGAGSVLHATGTRDSDHLGGLLKRMPWTGLCFFVGAAAICGLPPLNGFVSEFLIYLGALDGVAHGALRDASAVGLLLGIIASLALIGGLAAACFAKAFGIVFLGAPRSSHAEHAHEASAAMRIPMAILALGCLAVGLSGPLWIGSLNPIVACLAPDSSLDLAGVWGGYQRTMTLIVVAALCLIALAGFLAALRRRLLKGRAVTRGVTWDCGYAAPGARMQYTASSFAQPITQFFAKLLGIVRRERKPQGLFPAAASFASESPDIFRRRFFDPMFRGVTYALSHLRWLQHGRLQLYVLYIAITLLALLLWKLR